MLASIVLNRQLRLFVIVNDASEKYRNFDCKNLIEVLRTYIPLASALGSRDDEIATSFGLAMVSPNHSEIQVLAAPTKLTADNYEHVVTSLSHLSLSTASSPTCSTSEVHLICSWLLEAIQLLGIRKNTSQNPLLVIAYRNRHFRNELRRAFNIIRERNELDVDIQSVWIKSLTTRTSEGDDEVKDISENRGFDDMENSDDNWLLTEHSIQDDMVAWQMFFYQWIANDFNCAATKILNVNIGLNVIKIDVSTRILDPTWLYGISILPLPDPLTAIELVPLAGLCESVLWGLPLIAEATQDVHMEWEDMERNEEMFASLVKNLSVHEYALILSGNTLIGQNSFAFIAHQQSGRLLLKRLATQDMILHKKGSRRPSNSLSSDVEGIIAAEFLNMHKSEVYMPLYQRSTFCQGLAIKDLTSKVERHNKLSVPNTIVVSTDSESDQEGLLGVSISKKKKRSKSEAGMTSKQPLKMCKYHNSPVTNMEPRYVAYTNAIERATENDDETVEEMIQRLSCRKRPTYSSSVSKCSTSQSSQSTNTTSSTLKFKKTPKDSQFSFPAPHVRGPFSGKISEHTNVQVQENIERKSASDATKKHMYKFKPITLTSIESKES